MAKPVQPNSSKKPAPDPTAIPMSTRDVLWSDASIPGRNAESVADRAKSAAEATNGPVRIASAYQRAPTRHLNNRERKL
jgi:hypothetical protein